MSRKNLNCRCLRKGYYIIALEIVVSLSQNQEVHKADKGYWQYVIANISDNIFSAFPNYKIKK
jgi:hypothetical protein